MIYKTFFIIYFFVQSNLLTAQKFNRLQSLESLETISQSSKNPDEISVRNHVYIDGDSVCYVSSIHQPFGFTITDEILDQEFCDTFPFFNTVRLNGEIKFGHQNIDCNYSAEKDTFKNCFENIDIEDKYGKYALKEISYFKTEWLKETSFPFLSDDDCLIIYTYSGRRSEVFIFGVDMDVLDRIYFSQIELIDGRPEVLSNNSIPLWRNTKRALERFKKKINPQYLEDLSNKYLSLVKFDGLVSSFVVAEFFYQGNYGPFVFGVQYPIVMKKDLRKTKILYFLDDIYFPVLYEYGYVW